jgi:hypothetical protein
MPTIPTASSANSQRPRRSLQDDGDDLVARAHDGEADPAEGHGVREGEDPRLVVMSSQFARQPREARRREQEGAGGGHEIAQR